MSPGNRSERLQWFSDLGFGMFIHWSMDSQLGSVIGHSMARASADYLARFIDELPSTFHPRKFHPEDWAVLARLAGMRYVVFTTKHHSGFCMFHTATTRFGIEHTPFGRDITAEVVDAFRRQGLAIGLYFSPDDFHFLHGQGRAVHRGVQPEDCEGLLEHNSAQVRELLTGYGKIDLMFFDGPSQGLRELCWEADPDIVVTRGAMPTPEQRLPGLQSVEPWEACVTMGTGWQYKPTNERYKSGTQLIDLLIETRAKGGNLVLNVGPKPDGELPIEQEALLREIALWHFVNGEAVGRVQPWRLPNEGDVWLAGDRDGDAVYAFVRHDDPWPLYERRQVTLRSVRATASTTVHVLGQADDLQDAGGPAIQWRQDDDALRIQVARMQRLYNNRRWPNPVVLKITGAVVGHVPPAVTTGQAEADADGRGCLLHGQLTDLGEADVVEAGFEIHLRRLLTEPADPWRAVGAVPLRDPGAFSLHAGGLEPGALYEFRAVASHGDLRATGDHVNVQLPATAG